jgi:DNA-binding HxlR family transcriptional regulator
LRLSDMAKTGVVERVLTGNEPFRVGYGPAERAEAKVWISAF